MKKVGMSSGMMVIWLKGTKNIPLCQYLSEPKNNNSKVQGYSTSGTRTEKANLGIYSP